MPSDAEGLTAREDEFETIWTSRQSATTVLLGLPGVVVSAAFTGLLATIFFDVSRAVFIILGVAGVIVLFRIVTWTQFLAPRVVAVSETHLAVRRRDTTLREVSWSDVASVQLIPGDSLLRMMFDVISDDASFPYIVAKPTDVWDVRGSFPPLMAMLSNDRRQLELALSDACAARGLPFSVGDSN